MSERPRAYHLAWHRQHSAAAEGSLVYILVPVWLGVFRGSLELEAINACGRPLPPVRATAQDLASPRKLEDTEGFGHPVEMKLLRALAIRATNSGHILPALEPTFRLRGWARWALSEEQRQRLLRAGGAPV